MKNRHLSLILIILFVWLFVLTILFYEKYDSSSSKYEVNEYNVSGFSTDFSNIVEEVKSSIVAIEQNSNISSGFIYTKQDNMVYIISTFHGVSESENANIYFNNGVKVSAKVVGQDIFADVALLACEFPYEVKSLTLGDSDLLKSGEFVLSVGCANSLDYAFSSTFGMVSEKYREIENRISFNEENYNYYLGVIQLSGDYVNGYSGAPVINMNGEVVGLLSMEDDGNVLATTINEVKVVAKKLLNNEEYTRLNFGLSGRYIKDLENYEKNSLDINIEIVDGYYVSEVKNSSIASNMGILKGDIIKSINGIEILDIDSFLEVIYGSEKEISVELVRNNEELSLKGYIYD